MKSKKTTPQKAAPKYGKARECLNCWTAFRPLFRIKDAKFCKAECRQEFHRGPRSLAGKRRQALERLIRQIVQHEVFGMPPGFESVIRSIAADVVMEHEIKQHTKAGKL